MKNRLRVLRAERNWSQADLAARLEVSRQSDVYKRQALDVEGSVLPGKGLGGTPVGTNAIVEVRELQKAVKGRGSGRAGSRAKEFGSTIKAARGKNEERVIGRRRQAAAEAAVAH